MCVLCGAGRDTWVFCDVGLGASPVTPVWLWAYCSTKGWVGLSTTVLTKVAGTSLCVKGFGGDRGRWAVSPVSGVEPEEWSSAGSAPRGVWRH